MITPIPDFLPLTPGTTWTYGIKDWGASDNNFTDSVTLTATNQQMTFNGKTYTLVLANKVIFYPGIDSFYFHKDTGNNKTYSWLFRGQGLPRSFDAEILDGGRDFKADSYTNIPATNPTQPAPYQVSTIEPVTDYNETVTGKPYYNVTQVGVTILDRDPGNGDWQYYNEYSFDFAPHIGIIRMVDANWQGALALIHYNIKP